MAYTRTKQPVIGGYADALGFNEETNTLEVGTNLEVDGTLKVNSTLQVGDTTTNDDELAKLPRTLLLPISSPNELKLVGVDTSNEQNLLGIGESLIVENDKLKVGETMSDYAFIEQNPTNITNNVSYASVVKIGDKITFVIAGKITPNESNFYSAYVGAFSVPINVFNKMYPINESNDIARVQTYFGTATYAGVNVNGSWFKSGFNDLVLRVSGANLISGTTYDYRVEITILLSDNIAGN